MTVTMWGECIRVRRKLALSSNDLNDVAADGNVAGGGSGRTAIVGHAGCYW